MKSTAIVLAMISMMVGCAAPIETEEPDVAEEVGEVEQPLIGEDCSYHFYSDASMTQIVGICSSPCGYKFWRCTGQQTDYVGSVECFSCSL